MTLKFEELRVLQAAEGIADAVWRQVAQWNAFARDTVGSQTVRATDSIGANIAEAFGRFHFGEKLNFLYYARGSLFETKYWLNRASVRGLVPANQAQEYASQLSDLARQLNTFAADLKTQRRGASTSSTPTVRESPPEYIVGGADDPTPPLITAEYLAWLASVPNP